jgi:PAS domain S-box-containing protein
MEEGLLEKAKEIIKEPELIMDLYDFTIIWINKKTEYIIGFTSEELAGRPITELLAIDSDEMRAKVVEHMSKNHGFMDSSLKTKNGDIVDFKVEFYTFEFKKGFYHVGKAIIYTIRKRS